MRIYKRHPLSKIYGDMDKALQDELAVDIAENGQLEPGILLGGMILDGWHRYLACSDMGIEFAAAALSEGINPASVVRSKNRMRRHLSSQQLIDTEIAVLAWEKSREEKENGLGYTAIRPPDEAEDDEPQEEAIAKAKERVINDSKTAKKIAETTGVHQTTVSKHLALERHSNKDLYKAYKDGEINLEAALKQMKEEKAAANPKKKKRERSKNKRPLISVQDNASESSDMNDSAVYAETVELQQEDIRALKHENENLKAQLEETRERLFLAETDQIADSAARDESIYEEVKTRMRQLENENNTLRAVNDQHLEKMGAMQKTINYQKKQLGKK